MDIWAWVVSRYGELKDDGNYRLADLILSIPSHTTDDRHDLVDQLYPEALALSQSRGDKWLEIFFRHWYLQSQILNRFNAKGMLPHAVELLDFAHQEETKDCPQRICAVQDLTNCYGIMDGIGYADKRIEVARETLSSINGKWSCYACISSELVTALIDKGKFDLALRELDQSTAEMLKYGNSDNTSLPRSRTRALLGLGKFDEAMRVIQNAEGDGGGDGFVRHKKLLMALIYCAEKKWREASEACLSFEEASLASSYYGDWTDIQFQLVTAKHVQNNEALRGQFHAMAAELSSKDASRTGLSVFSRLIELCLNEGALFRASVAIEQMGALLPKLHRDFGATDILKGYRKKIAVVKLAQAEKQIFASPESVLEYEFSTADEEARAYEKAHDSWPENIDITVRLAQLYDSYQLPNKALNILEYAYGKSPNNSLLEHAYGNGFLAAHGYEAYAKKFPMDNLDDLSKSAIWNRAFTHLNALEKTAPERALQYINITASYWPDDPMLLRKSAEMNIELGRYAAAIPIWQALIKIEPASTNNLWDLITAATVEGDTKLIIEAASALEMTLNDKGEYAEGENQAIRVEMDDDGFTASSSAIRIGPTLARISEIKGPGIDQIYGHEVVIDPLPKNALDDEDDEGTACDAEGYYTLLYPAIKTLKTPKSQVFTLDGVHPGDTALAELEKLMTQEGYVYQEWVMNGYELNWSDGDDDDGVGDDDGDGDENQTFAKGVYIYILAREGADLTKLHEILTEFSAKQAHPLVWPELLEELKLETILSEHVKISDKYDM